MPFPEHGAGRETDRRIGRDVVALVGARPWRAACPWRCAPSRGRRPRRSSRQRRCAAELTTLASCGDDERHPDHLDAEQRGVRILLAARPRSIRRVRRRAGRCSFRRRTPRGCSCPWDRGSGCACASRGRSARRRSSSDASDALMSKMRTPRNRSRLTVVLDTLRAAVDAAARLFDRHEHQVAVDRRVTLAAGAHHRRAAARVRRMSDTSQIWIP